MGLQIAIFHVLSAVVVVVVTDIAVKSVTGSGLSDFGLVRKISYGAIICIGILMLWSAVKTWRHRSRHSHHEHHHQDHKHSHGCSACSALDEQAAGKSSRMAWLSLAVGSIPCTGAILVLLFGIANNALGSAVILVIAISAGMAVALIGVGVAAIGGHRLAFRFFPDKARDHFSIAMRLIGSSAVVVVGVVLFSYAG